MEDEYIIHLRNICSRFPEVEEGQLQDRSLFHVRRRRIAIYNSPLAPMRKRWQGWGCSLHFATHPGDRERLMLDERFKASPHHGFRGWVGVRLQHPVDWREVSDWLLQAYRQVANKNLVAELEGRIIYE